MPPDLTPFTGARQEFLLLASCCKGRLASEKILAGQIGETGMQWDIFLRLVERHHAGGIAFLALQSTPGVPQPVRTSLAASAQRILLSNLRALGLQRELARLFGERGIDFVVLKGTPLCVEAFGDLRARYSRDIDLLIRPGDTAAAEQVLLLSGWQATGLGATVGRANAPGWKAVRKDYEYLHNATGVRLELHWRPFDNAALGHNLLERRTSVEVANGITLPVLPRTDLLLNLCVHGAGHAWFRLKWIADVAALLQQGGCDARELLAAAKEQGLERPVLQAMFLCRELFGCSIVGLPARPTPAVAVLLKIGRRAMLTEHVSSPSAESAFVPPNLALSNLLLRTDLRYVWNEARLRLASPADEAAFPLPPALRFAYPLLRVPLWIRRRWFSRQGSS